MKFRVIGYGWLRSLIVIVTVLAPLRAQDDSATNDKPLSNFNQLLGFSKYLRLEPKTITGADGTDATIGLGYEYKRRFADVSKGGDLDLYFESAGFLAAEKDESADRQLEHKLRLNLIDLLSHKRADDYERFEDPDSKQSHRRLKEQQRIYQSAGLAEVRQRYRAYLIETDEQKRAEILKEAQEIWKRTSDEDLVLGPDNTWPQIDALEGNWMDRQAEFKAGVSRPWLSLEVNAGAESDQDFRDVQYAGGALLYGKWQLLGTPVDFLCKSIRGYDEPHNFLNYQGGPYFWAGFEIVDATENNSRNGITGGDDDTFGRFHAGVFYRNELFSFGEGRDAEAVSLEFTWEFYSELDAPDSIEAADGDDTSYVKAALLFDNGMFLEYKDGRKPIDIDDSSALSVGFRFGM